MRALLRGFLVLALVLVVCSRPAQAAYTLIGSVSAGSSAGGAITTGNLNTTGATLLVLAVGYYAPAGAASISDSKSNTWAALTVSTRGGGDADAIRFYYVAGGVVGTGHNFTNSASNYSSLCVLAFSGSAASPFDQENSDTQDFGTSVGSGALTPSQNGALVVAAVALRGYAGDGQTVSVDSGQTKQEEVTGAGGAHAGVAISYEIQTTATLRNPTWSWATADQAQAATAAFLLATTQSAIVLLGVGR